METPPNNTSKQSKIVLTVVFAVSFIAVIGVAALLIMNPATPASEHDHASHSHGASHTGTQHANGETAAIAYTDSGFSPATLTVTSGTTVTVTNNSSHAMMFASGPHPAHNEDPEINLDELQPGESASFIATTTGTHGFHDHMNDDLTGTLVVTK